MRPSELIKYYSQDGFVDFMLSFSNNREVVPRFRDKFGLRPQTFRFNGELMDVIRRGVSSFHFSQERWTNPMALSSDMGVNELNSLRTGWDLIFDVDSKVLDYSKVCTKLIIDALEFHDINNVSVKFSGGTGFHVGVSFNNPTVINGELVKDLFPEAPRIIGLYIQNLISDYLKDSLLKIDPVERVAERAGVDFNGVFDPLKVVNIDPVAISSRHLIRAPYSLNEKKWLVSVPIKPGSVLDFTVEQARPEVVDFSLGFLDSPVDAAELFVQSFDWFKREQSKVVVKPRSLHELPKSAVSVDKFPPCIINILKGLTDGRKRALFMLSNFYHKCGYSWSAINELIIDWNSKNKPPLKLGLIKSQLDWAMKQGGLMPPNCSSPNYKDIGVCSPDNLCSKIKNPVTYSLHKAKSLSPVKRRKRNSFTVSRRDSLIALKSVVKDLVIAKLLYSAGIKTVNQLNGFKQAELISLLKKKHGNKLTDELINQLKETFKS